MGGEAERLATAVQRPLVVGAVERYADEFDEERTLRGVQQFQTRLDVEGRRRRLHRQRVLVVQPHVSAAALVPIVQADDERHVCNVSHTRALPATVVPHVQNALYFRRKVRALWRTLFFKKLVAPQR